MRLLLAVKADFVYRTEGDDTRLECKKGMVFAETYIFARNHASAALADYNIASLSRLAGIELNAEIFRL